MTASLKIHDSKRTRRDLIASSRSWKPPKGKKWFVRSKNWQRLLKEVISSSLQHTRTFLTCLSYRAPDKHNGISSCMGGKERQYCHRYSGSIEAWTNYGESQSYRSCPQTDARDSAQNRPYFVKHSGGARMHISLWIFARYWFNNFLSHLSVGQVLTDSDESRLMLYWCRDWSKGSEQE